MSMSLLAETRIFREHRVTFSKDRASDPDSRVKIIVGGHALNASKELWKELGADGYASNAEEAVLVANELLDRAEKG